MIIQTDKKAMAAMALLICLATIAIIVAVNSGSKNNVTSSASPPSEDAYHVVFSDVAIAGKLVIKLLPTVASDGSLVYQVLTPQGTALGTFNYIPWQDQNPLFRELPGGDMILGSHSLYRKSDQKIHPLGENAGLSSVSDYSVNGNTLALAGTDSQASDNQIIISVENLTGGTWTQIDSFQYPDYLSTKQACLCWAGGKLYYDSCQDYVAVIKEYDPATNQSSVFKDNAMNPLASPDGRYLAMFATDAPSTTSGNALGLELIDLDSCRATGMIGSSRLFWSPDYVTVWDGDNMELHIYTLSSGAQVADVPADSPVADLSLSNNILSGTSYHFSNRQITRQRFQVNINR